MLFSLIHLNDKVFREMLFSYFSNETESDWNEWDTWMWIQYYVMLWTTENRLIGVRFPRFNWPISGSIAFLLRANIPNIYYIVFLGSNFLCLLTKIHFDTCWYNQNFMFIWTIQAKFNRMWSEKKTRKIHLQQT